jgi:tetratricopeptide (TPR) repeat protein
VDGLLIGRREERWARDMPKARELLDTGIRYEAGGVPDKALEAFVAAEAAATDEPAVRIEAMRRQADVLRTRCAWAKAVEAARRSAEAAKRAGEPILEAEALNAEAAVYQSRGDFAEATALYDAMLRMTPDDRIRGIALQNLAAIAAQSGDQVTAEQRFLESYQHFQAAGYRRGEAIALNNYGRCLLDQGDVDSAEPILEQAVAKAADLGDLELLALARLNFAEVRAQKDDLGRAEELASAALGYFGVTENRWRRVECLRLLGDIALRRGQPAHARAFFEAGLRSARELNARVEQQQLEERLKKLHDD